MATPSQLAIKLGLLLRSIEASIGSKLGLTARAADSALLEGKSLAGVRDYLVNDTLSKVNGRRGEVAFFGEEGTPMALVSGEMVNKIRMANDDTAITNAKNEVVSFADVYNSWQRISHGNNLQFPNNVAEMNSWSYDAGTDSIKSTVNSGTMIGMIGPDRFEEYTFETIVSSTGNDDDAAGMCAAFKRANGREYTLTVMVSGGGMLADGSYSSVDTPMICCTMNYTQGAKNGMQVLWSHSLGIPRQFWSADGPLKAGIRIKLVRRTAGTLEITATQADGTEWPNPAFTTVNLPTIFKEACQIGYVAVSQPLSTWKNITVPVAKRDIIDLRDSTVWRWNAVSSSWVNAGKYTNPAVLIPGRIYKNTLSPYGAHYLDYEGVLLALGIPGVL